MRRGNNDRFVVTDLIRCTLVERGAAPRLGVTTRSDKNIDLNLRAHRTAYAAYADLPESRNWLWDRIIGTKSSTIIALGRAPYCGLMRLFREQEVRHDVHSPALQRSWALEWFRRLDDESRLSLLNSYPFASAGCPLNPTNGCHPGSSQR